MSNFSDFCTEHGIEATALNAASAGLEKHNTKDRAVMIARVKARKAKKGYDESDDTKTKPKSLGRGVSTGTIKRAMEGKPLPRIARSKLVRAVNANLVSAKKDAVDWRVLFADAPVKRGKSK